MNKQFKFIVKIIIMKFLYNYIKKSILNNLENNFWFKIFEVY